MDCDIIRSSTSWEVTEEAKENWFPDSIGSSSDSPEISSGIEAVVQEEELFADLEAMHEVEWWGLGGARALETSRAEALHDLERNSMGALGLSGRWVMLAELYSGRRENFRGNVSSMKVNCGRD